MNDFQLTDSSDAAVYADTVLRRLESSGANGVALSNLLAKKPAVRVMQERVLKELEKAGHICRVRKGKVTRCWLAAHLPPQITPEEKADQVLRRVLPEQRRERLLTLPKIRSELLKGLGIKDAAIRTCLRVLEQEGLLVKLVEGTKTFYAYAPSLRALLGEATPPVVAPPKVEAPPPAPVTVQPGAKQVTARELASMKTIRASEVPLPVTNQRVIEAYRSVRLQKRLPDVEIARLQEVLHCTAEELKPVVVRLCEQGVFIPGKGDWSFATTLARAASVLIQGEPHLFVRMKE